MHIFLEPFFAQKRRLFDNQTIVGETPLTRTQNIIKMYRDTPELIKFVREHANDYDTLKRKDVPRCLTIKRSRNGRYFSVYIEKFGEISFKEVLNVFPLLPKSYLNE